MNVACYFLFYSLQVFEKQNPKENTTGKEAVVSDAARDKDFNLQYK